MKSLQQLQPLRPSFLSLPLQLMHQQVRVMRIYEGPSEVHRSAIGRRVLGSKV